MWLSVGRSAGVGQCSVTVAKFGVLSACELALDTDHISLISANQNQVREKVNQ